MAYYDSKKNEVIRFAPARHQQYPNWIAFDCGCSSGLQWGGESPRDCRDCWGTGWLSVHVPSGTIALYPGGALMGCKMERDRIDALVKEVDAI